MKIGTYIIYSFLVLVFISCETQNGITPPDKDVEELVSAGWEQFEVGNYQSALEKFEEAISKDENYAEAYNGAGWASAHLNNLSDAVSYLSQAVSINASLVDAHAGLACVYNAQKAYQSTITSANKALNLSSIWVFSHDETINYKDLYLILAASYFALGNFSQSLAQVQKLNPSFTADINTFEGRSALAEEIERLKGIV